MKKREILKKLWKNQTSLGYGFLVFRLALLIGSILLSLALDDNPNLTTLRYRLYQYQMHFARNAELPPQRVAVITIDDADYWGSGFEGRSPLNRNELAAILHRLCQAGVNTVVLDVDLRSPCPDANGQCLNDGTKQPAKAAEVEAKSEAGVQSCEAENSATGTTVNAQDFAIYQSEDAALYNSISAFCSSGRNVVLSSSLRYKDGGYVEAPQIFAPEALPKCVRHGYLQLPYDVRQLPGTQQLENGHELDSLSMAAVRIANPTAYRLANEKSSRGFRYVRYLTENDFAAHDERRYSYPWHELKDADVNTLRRDLTDRIVLIGGHWHTYAPGQGPTVDSYDSPAGRMAGVFLHANYIEAIASERGTFTAVPDWFIHLVEFVYAILLWIISEAEIRPAWKWIAQPVGLLLNLVFVYFLLQNLGIFMDCLLPLTAQLGASFFEWVYTLHRDHRLYRKLHKEA
jgi:CHASE2 domain-containing sensor protein